MLLFERRDEGADPYTMVKESIARTLAIEGSCIGIVAVVHIGLCDLDSWKTDDITIRNRSIYAAGDD